MIMVIGFMGLLVFFGGVDGKVRRFGWKFLWVLRDCLVYSALKFVLNFLFFSLQGHADYGAKFANLFCCQGRNFIIKFIKLKNFLSLQPPFPSKF